MAIAGNWFVTPHAVRQFQARVAPGLGYDQALGAIVRGMRRAGPLRPTRNQQAVYTRVRSSAEYPYDFRAVIGPGEGPKPCILTILRSGKGRGGAR